MIQALPWIRRPTSYHIAEEAALTTSLSTRRIAASGDITTGLLGWWKFDEGSGTTAIDSGSAGNDGTLVNSPIYVTGQVGPYALQFDGNANYVQASDSAMPSGNSPRTIAFWLNTIATGSQDRYAVSYGNAGSGNSFDVGTWNNGSIVLVTGTAAFGATSAVNDGIWHHVAVAFDGSNAFIYRDGIASGSFSMTLNTSLGGEIMTGRNFHAASSAFYLSADIDDVMAFNRALSQDDITKLYNYR